MKQMMNKIKCIRVHNLLCLPIRTSWWLFPTGNKNFLFGIKDDNPNNKEIVIYLTGRKYSKKKLDFIRVFYLKNKESIENTLRQKHKNRDLYLDPPFSPDKDSILEEFELDVSDNFIPCDCTDIKQRKRCLLRKFCHLC